MSYAYGEEIDAGSDDDDEDDLECEWESPCEDEAGPLIQTVLEPVGQGQPSNVLALLVETVVANRSDKEATHHKEFNGKEGASG